MTIGTEDPSSLWCLLMTSPDGHFTKANSEYVHYLVYVVEAFIFLCTGSFVFFFQTFSGNIKGPDASSGVVLAKYMQPFPPKGTGYHRYVFLLFKQNKPIDFSSWKVNEEG